MKRFCALVVAILCTGSVAAQEKAITINWFGQSCFQIITPAGKKIVTDPHFIEAFGEKKPEADLVLISHEHSDHNQVNSIPNFKEKKPKVIRGLKTAGINKLDWNPVDEKWEGVQIRSFGTYHDESEGTKRGKNSMFILNIDGIIICHCGDLGHEFTPKQIKAIGPIDVLLIPVGGIFTINGRAAVDVVDQIKPRLFVLPMHYGVEGFDDLQTTEEFFDGMKFNKKPIQKIEGYSLTVLVGSKPKAEGYTVIQMGGKKKE